MSGTSGTNSILRARHDLLREQMGEFGHELGWLTDPGLVPDNATATKHELLDDPFASLGLWMINAFVRWSEKTRNKLGYGETFDKYGLTGAERCTVRSQISNNSALIYTPGIMAVAEVYQVVPAVATREGITDPDVWSHIGLAACNFGSALSRRGTNVQAITRNFLGIEYSQLAFRPYDPAKFKLDSDTGVTSTVPVRELVDLAFEASKAAIGEDDTKPVVCPALYSPVQGLDGISMYDAVWGAFGQAAEKLIFPTLDIDPNTVPSARYYTSEDAQQYMNEVAMLDAVSFWLQR